MQDACACGLYVRFLWIVRARECAIFLVNKVFVQVENAKIFRLAPLGARKNSWFP